MSFAEIWDRFFWSLLLFLFVTFVWLRFVDDVAAYSPTEFVVSAAAAGVYFLYWWRQQRAAVDGGAD